MESLKELNQIDIKIAALRLDMIRIIAEINRMIHSKSVKNQPEEYNALKNKYYDTNKLVLELGAAKVILQEKLQEEKDEAA